MYIIYLQFSDGSQGYYKIDEANKIYSYPTNIKLKDKDGNIRITTFPSQAAAEAKAARLKEHFKNIVYAEVLVLKE